METECLRENGWQCMHARLAAQRMQAPLFLVQSSLDAWQLANIWRGATLTNSSIDPRSCIGSLYEAPRHTITLTLTLILTRTRTRTRTRTPNQVTWQKAV